MPKVPPDLPRLLPDANPSDRVAVQQTAFTDDVTGRFVCNEWAEVEASIADGGRPPDVVVVAGMFGAYCAEKLYRSGAAKGLRILLLDAGPLVFTTHVQNQPQRLGDRIGAPRYDRVREDGTGTQNVVWGIPWIGNVPFPGLAYCIGGRSLFWGGWSPQLTSADLAAWPGPIRDYLTLPAGSSAYELTEVEIGTNPTADFMQSTAFHAALLARLTAAGTGLPILTGVAEAPLAVQGSPPASGLFAFDKFSSGPFLVDAVRDDVSTNTGAGDVSRRLFLVPRTSVVRLNVNGGRVTSIDLRTNGAAVNPPLQLPPTGSVVLANGTIEATRIALDSLGVGSTTFGSPRVGNLMAHLRSDITVRIRRTALGLPAGPPLDLETTAFLVRGSSGGRRFHFQVIAAAIGGTDPERNVFQQVPDIDLLAQMRANQSPDKITITLRAVGEMEDSQTLNPDPTRSWIDLSPEIDPLLGVRRAYVNLVATGADTTLWTDMDTAAFDLADALAGGAANIEYLHAPTGTWVAARPSPAAGTWWRKPLGSTHHEAGTLFMGGAGAAITNLDGRFHNVANAYVAGPALFPTIGSANPSLTALALAARTADAIIAAAP